MTMEAGGLVKLIEELCELGQVAAKKLAYYDTDDHPDGQGSLKERMEEEMGDVMAAMLFVSHHFNLDDQKVTTRADHKLAVYQEWNRENGHSENSN